MYWQDLINGSYELFGGVFILLSIIKLFRDKHVRGVSVWHAAYFTSWGIWNLYYYPHLNQWASFVGGIGVVATNGVWVLLMIYYVHREQRSSQRKIV